MHSLSRSRPLGMAAVPIAVQATVRGPVIFQAAGGQSGIQALIYDDVVRFVLQNDEVTILTGWQEN